MIYQAVWYEAFIIKAGMFIIHSSFSNLNKEIKGRKGGRKEGGREQGRVRKRKKRKKLLSIGYSVG